MMQPSARRAASLSDPNTHNHPLNTAKKQDRKRIIVEETNTSAKLGKVARWALLVSSRQSPPTWVTQRTSRAAANKAVSSTASHSRWFTQPQRHNIPFLALER